MSQSLASGRVGRTATRAISPWERRPEGVGPDSAGPGHAGGDEDRDPPIRMRICAVGSAAWSNLLQKAVPFDRAWWLVLAWRREPVGGFC